MNIEKIKARAEAATAETNVFYRINSLTPEDLEHSLDEDGYNTCLLKLMAHALFDIPALLDALEAKERELAEYRTAEEQGLLIRLPCKVGAGLTTELIDKAVLIERIDKFIDLAPDTAMHLEDCISGTPAIDAVEVVFCKNCQHRETINCITSERVNDNDYCSYGRKSLDKSLKLCYNKL